MAPPTILALKQFFLVSETRLLAQPIAPSRVWRTSNDEAEDGLPRRVLEDALLRLNQTLLQHERRVHPPQATRHVAEQIERLYWDDERAADDDDDDDDNQFSKAVFHALSTTSGADTEAIACLPRAWPDDVSAHAPDAKRYAEAVARLQTLAAQRDEAAARVARLRGMVAALGSFGDGGVQENLVTRDGEVEHELARMRVLLARVGGRVSQLRGREGAEGGRDGTREAMGVDELDAMESRKVDDLLGRFGDV